MGFKIKYKQMLQDSAGSPASDKANGGGGPGGGGGGGGATPLQLPPREPSPLPRHSPSPPGDKCKVPQHNAHYDRYDQSGQHGGPTKLYVGNLSPHTRRQDLEALFRRYGRLRSVYLVESNYGFVVFYDPRDAEAARNGIDGQDMFGRRITVQFAREHKLTQYDTHYIHDDRNHRQGGNSKLFVSNISPRTREHDIKDLFSKYGRVREVNLRENDCFVEFCDPQDADDARCRLSGQKFDGNRIGVEFATGVPHGSEGSAHIRCFNCGTIGHFVADCKVGSWKDRCYQCGEKGHLQRECRNSPKDFGQRRSPPRSPDHGRGQSWRRYRSRSRGYRSSAEPW